MSRNVPSIALATFMAFTAMFVSTIVYAAGCGQAVSSNPTAQTVKNDTCGSCPGGASKKPTNAMAPATDTKSIPVFSALKSGMDYNIYADNRLFLTVTHADAQARGTTPEKLAGLWVERLNTTLPGILSTHQPREMQAGNMMVPRATVIRAMLDKPLSSATSKVGDKLHAYQQGIVAGGFPEKTKFTGKVVSVAKASGNIAGQIGIRFVSAKLPDGRSLPIEGRLVSLDEHSTMMDKESGRLMSKAGPQGSDSMFIASGAGAGLAIGQPYGNNPFLGAVLGGGSGSLYSQQQVTPAIGQDVRVPAGTEFGILMDKDVSLSYSPPPAPEYESNH